VTTGAGSRLALTIFFVKNILPLSSQATKLIFMRLVFISDTHGSHGGLSVPDGDILVFCGDLAARGEFHEIEDFLSFMKSLSHRHKIMFAGNHDFAFEDLRREKAIAAVHEAGVIYLNDSQVVVEGIKFWGSPVSPRFFDWAFNRDRGVEIKRHWDLIPVDTDVLVTHGPPFGILDETKHKEKVGCADLLEKVLKNKPRIHAFGHIHEGYGVKQVEGITFIIASNLDHAYRLCHPPIVMDWDKRCL
jgi:Icc-related predicted phosphoesterase